VFVVGELDDIEPLVKQEVHIALGHEVSHACNNLPVCKAADSVADTSRT
jgi:hypothetical protein